MNYYILLISFIFVWFSPCNGGSGISKAIMTPMFLRSIGLFNLDEIDMKMGDTIDCISHFLLATDPGIVIHIVSNKNRGHKVQQRVSDLSSKKYICQNMGPGPRGAWEAVKLARWQESYFASLGRDFFYDFFTCNSEHWLNLLTGRSLPKGSLRSANSTSPDCEVLGLNPEFFESATDCEWTNCQLHNANVCKLYGRWRKDMHNCDGGIKLHCCKK